MTRRRGWSDITVTDVFCGAGGNTIGAKRAGLRVRVGLNHWQRAIDTYQTNNPEVDVVRRVDVTLCDPRRFPSTNIGIFSPECTTHSPAGGNKHRKDDWHPNLFAGPAADPATVRSRVTMLDVVRFTEYHEYEIVIVENVVEAMRWVLFAEWLKMMECLGYQWKILSLNSMFFHPTPQSRDRIYVVFWRKGNRAPDLEYRPPAPCGKCSRVVEALQVWKNGRTVGKYRRQYVYACPRCASIVTPFYYAALNALDFSLEAERIGDRSRPLRPRTMERIAYGLEKFGRRTLVVNVKQGERDSSRAWPAELREIGTVPSWDNYFGVSHPSPFIAHMQGESKAYGVDGPMATQLSSTVHDALIAPPGFLVETAHSHDNNKGARGADEPHATISAQQTSALVSPFIVTAGSRASSAAGTDPMPAQTGTERLAVVSPFLVTLRTNGEARSATDPATAVCAAGNHHVLIQGAAQISLRDANAMRVAGLDSELMTQGCGPQQALIQEAPFIVSHYGTNNASPTDAPVPTVTSIDRHELISPSPFILSQHERRPQGVDSALPAMATIPGHALVEPRPDLRVEDCYFRMLQPHEIGAAMAFPEDYEVGGNKRDRVKQYGNAVTPPVMDWIVRRCAATLAPELSEDVA